MWLFYFSIISLLGILTAKRLHLSSLISLLIGPSLGVIIISEATLLLSLIMSFHFGAIILSLILYFLATIYFFRKNYWNFIEIKKTIINHKAFVILGTFLIFYAIFIFSSRVLSNSQGNLLTGTGGMWADTAMHSAFTMSLVEQGIPPQNPLFAQIPLIYPFMVNFFSAILVKLGASLQYSFIIPHIFYFIAFISLFFIFGKRIVGKRATVFALLIFLFGWGVGFTTYIQDYLKTGNLIPIREYTNNHGLFHFHNVLTGLIFPERSMLPGLVIGLLITYLSLQTFNSKKLSTKHLAINTIGILLGILPLWHTHTFLFFTLAVLFWQIIPYLRPNNIGNTGIKPLLITLSIAAVIALPQLIFLLNNLSHQSFIHLSLGWMKSEEKFLTFWLLNTGLLIPLSLVGWWKLKSYRLFFIPAFIIFIFANIVMLSPWDWDNIKLFTWAGLFLSLLAGMAVDYALCQCEEHKRRSNLFNIISKLSILIIFLSLIFSGLLSNFELLQNRYTIYDQADQELANWVRKNTKSSDVFLIDPWVNHPLTGLTGRSAYMGYPGQLWVHGIKYQKREALINKVLAGNIETLKQTEVPVHYLIVEKYKTTNFPTLEKVYENAKFTIFKITSSL